MSKITAPRGAAAFALISLSLLAALPQPVRAIPAFARQYDVPCSRCHVQPPRLNAFGEQFRRQGYRADGLRPARGTVPVAVWASARSDAFLDEPEVREAVAAYLNKLEVIAAGRLAADWLSYFVEWRPVSLETTRRDGEIRLRDRSGRFEDLFLMASKGRVSLTAGQFRQVDQVDVSLRLGLSEPLLLAASLPGSAAGLPTGPDGAVTPEARRRLSLRGFSPAGRAPAVRVAYERPTGAWAWTTALGVAAPGEFSIPLTSEARTEASNEFELRAKGVVLESYIRRGVTSLGAHLLYADADRFLINGITTGRLSDLYWLGGAGVERASDRTGYRGRWTLQAEYLPHYLLGIGTRVEDRAGDSAEPAVLPYFRAHFPGTRYTVYLAVERRIQSRNNVTLLEVGTVF